MEGFCYQFAEVLNTTVKCAPLPIIIFFYYFLKKEWTQTQSTSISQPRGLYFESIKTRTTNVVRNAGCARSRYTLKLSLIFFNQSINESTEYI